MSSTYVPPKGPPNPRYTIVGEQPGRNEVRHPHLGPFSGPAGENLQDCLRVAGISWSDCWRTNVIKDLEHPIEYYIAIKGGRNGKAVVSIAGEAYIDSLRNELSTLSSNIILACGNVALWALCSRIGITSWRGSILDSTLIPGHKVIPTVHPATWTQEKLYSNPDAYLNKYLVVLDLKRAKLESEYPGIKQWPRKLTIQPTYHEVCNFISMCMTHADVGGIIDYDIETTPRTQELSCIGLAFSPHWAMCIPFIDANGDYFSVEQECNIMLLLEELFSNPKWRKRGQNVIFDSHFLLRKYGIRTYNLEDTMIAQGILWPEMRKGLDFITSVWTDIPYYKRDGKQFLEGMTNWQRGWQYNCLDVLSCAEAHPKQLDALAEQGNLSTYERQRLLIPPLTYMMERGIKVDLAGMVTAAENCKHEIEELTLKVSNIIGYDCISDASYAQTKKELNLSSPMQLAEYFYIEKGIKPYVNPDTHQPTTDITALTRLANKGYHEASLILQIRKLSKRRSTFLDVTQIDNDGRMRCQYNPVGTKYGRVSSSESIFGSGTNLQNQPHEVLTYFLADDGYIIYSLDMSQIENRIVAYVGNILPMVEAFEGCLDMHRVTAAMTLGILGTPTTWEEVTPDQRQIFGKRPNHAFNYGYSYRSYALKYEVPEREAKRIYNAYHLAYPGLRNSYWALVQRQLKENRILTNLYGRNILFLGLWSDKLLHEAYSAIPQSTCGDHVNERGLEFTYYNETPEFRSVELLTQLHDSITFQMPLSVPLSVHAQVLLAVRMSLETPLEYNGHKFVVPADLTIGKCMNKEMGIELKGDKFPHDTILLEQKLHNAITKLGE